MPRCLRTWGEVEELLLARVGRVEESLPFLGHKLPVEEVVLCPEAPVHLEVEVGSREEEDLEAEAALVSHTIRSFWTYLKIWNFHFSFLS